MCQPTDSKSHCQFPVELLCYLLSQAPAPLKPMITTNQSFIFFASQTWFVLIPPFLPISQSSLLSSSLPSTQALLQWVCVFLMCRTWHSKIPHTHSARFFLHAGETPRRVTARKNLDLHCRKCALASVWNIFSTEKISWAFRWWNQRLLEPNFLERLFFFWRGYWSLM